jgi:eukaryotic-like serine/threonine-protein kinase
MPAPRPLGCLTMAPRRSHLSLESGRMLLHYRVVERVGAGGMGIVWKAVDTALDREVAIKVLPETVAADPERLARFEREAKVLASLNHPNVAAVYGLHEDAGVRFLAMELVRGHPLADEIAGGLPPSRVVELGIAIADGLAAAHRQHVTHRDLKPDNVMIDADARPKILDFGLAKIPPAAAAEDAATVLGVTTTREGVVTGTVAYMSPEQAQGQPVGPRSDVFSLGIVLHEMSTGRRPFDGDNALAILTSIMRDEPPPIATGIRPAPARLEAIVRRCLEKDPDRRYKDAAGVRDDLRDLHATLISHASAPVIARRGTARRWIAIAAAAVILLAAIGTWWYQRNARARWARNDALPRLVGIVDRIQGLEEGREAWDAYVLTREIEATGSSDPLLERLRPRFTREITVTSDPPGATVSARYYDDPQAAPVVIGTTPLNKVRYPRGFTRVHVALPGRRAVDDVIWNFPLVGDTWSYTLAAPGALPDDMSLIPAGSFSLFMPGLDHLPAERTAAFLMDRHEMTNGEYKRFVEAGGYATPTYWQQPFVERGRELTWNQAMTRFVDRTGRPGPATWEVGSYPEGRADYPVAGVSWYEAAAYAAWAGKSLPTVFHWNRVAFTVASSRIIPMSNLAGTGPLQVGTTKGVNRFGVSDLAGNVREWTWNGSGRGAERFILGGGWNDPDYAFADAYAQPAFDRSPTNGFRCIKYLGQEPNAAALARAIDRPTRDFRAETPVSDAVFEQYLRQFDYDKTALDARIEEDKTLPAGRRQKITFAAAYGGERMLAYLFLPTGGTPPYQTVVLFPGSGAISTRSSKTLDPGRVDFLTKSGRAVMHPIYKGTFERGGDLRSDYPEPTARYKDYVIMWVKDLARSIDYLESRHDLDASRVAYYGLSWGGALGAVLPAVEPRITVNVLYVAGLTFQHALPEVDQINYITRVKQPTLILNAELDFFFPTQTSQRPMFELLGTPAADKRRMVYPGGHSVPRTEMIKESLQWLDRYLGPVGSAGS